VRARTQRPAIGFSRKRRIAVGKPRSARTIGSFENWAHVVGGVLEVAGIAGFLDNLEEMMEASDTEGAAWSAFIAAW